MNCSMFELFYNLQFSKHQLNASDSSCIKNIGIFYNNIYLDGYTYTTKEYISFSLVLKHIKNWKLYMENKEHTVIPRECYLVVYGDLEVL